MSLQEVLEDFRQFLLSNFVVIKTLLSEELMGDWLQANWEIIVEARLQESNQVRGVLDIYGDGADCNCASSRVSLPDLIPECAIHVKNGFVFHSFGTLRDGCFAQLPPFDYVKGEDKTSEVVVKVGEAQFTVGPAYDSIAK